jgi:hypothetical protein
MKRRIRIAAASGMVASMILLVVGSATTGSAGAQAPGCLPTSDRTVGPHAFAGLGIKRRAAVYTDALQFARILLPDLPTLQNPGPGPEADALTSEGFVSGISQHYFARTRKSHGDGGIAKNRAARIARAGAG